MQKWEVDLTVGLPQVLDVANTVANFIPGAGGGNTLRTSTLKGQQPYPMGKKVT